MSASAPSRATREAFGATLVELAEQGVKLCIGSAAEIEKNAEMFDTIVTDWAE